MCHDSFGLWVSFRLGLGLWSHSHPTKICSAWEVSQEKKKKYPSYEIIFWLKKPTHKLNRQWHIQLRWIIFNRSKGDSLLQILYVWPDGIPIIVDFSYKQITQPHMTEDTILVLTVPRSCGVMIFDGISLFKLLLPRYLKIITLNILVSRFHIYVGPFGMLPESGHTCPLWGYGYWVKDHGASCWSYIPQTPLKRHT